MPNVLLIGGSSEFYEKLSSDSRWHVLRATYGNTPSRDELGDPKRWDLIINEAAYYDGANDSGAPAVVSYDYIQEAVCANRIRFAPRQQQGTNTRTVPTDGNYDLEFNQTDAEEAAHLVDFVEEFEQDFGREHLRFSWSPVDQVLFHDSYGNPLIVLHTKTLHVIEPHDDYARMRALEYLCKHTVPKLWPEVYSDLFRPSRVVTLGREREQVIAELREQRARLDAEIDEELRYYAAYAPLTELADDALKLLVKRVFEDVFHLDTTDLDQDLDEGESKDLDLLLRREGWSCFVEVKASANRATAVRYIERLDEHVPRVEARHGPATSKAFVFNGMYWREPEQRTDDRLFSNDVVDEAQLRGVTLLSTFTLLRAIEARRNDELTDEQFIEALSTPGVFKSRWKTD